MGCGASSLTSPSDRVAGASENEDEKFDETSTSYHAYNVTANASRAAEEFSTTTVRLHKHVYDTGAIVRASPTSGHLDDSAASGYHLYKDAASDKGREAGQHGTKRVNFKDDDHHLGTGGRDGATVDPNGYDVRTDEDAKTEKSVVAAQGVATAEARRSRTTDDVETVGYTRNDVGLMELFLDFRPRGERPAAVHGPRLALAICTPTPNFICGAPFRRLMDWSGSDQGWRHQIQHRSRGAGTFLSTVASIASEASLLKQVVPDDAYHIGTDRYDGVFHARFWSFGKWEDVYTDDYLPIVDGYKPWGAHSASDEDEMWVALLEKALARYHGSYAAVYGGQSGDAFMALTSGIGERIDLKDDNTSALFSRLNNAISSGAQVTCSVPDEDNGQNGLIGGHAYTLTGVSEVNGTKLLLVWNPWGHTEWTGAWSDRSPEWQDVAEWHLKREDKDDGEFWVSLADFTTYFSDITICSLTPDFDQDGATADDLLSDDGLIFHYPQKCINANFGSASVSCGQWS